jgi:hypothetical protein
MDPRHQPAGMTEKKMDSRDGDSVVNDLTSGVRMTERELQEVMFIGDSIVGLTVSDG